MTLPAAVHDRLTEMELIRLIQVCAECTCPPEVECYCARNMEWGERRLAELRARTALEQIGNADANGR